MKKWMFILLVACVAFVGCEKAAEARCRTRTVVAEDSEDHNVLGLKVDAPNLVKIAEEWSLGIEGGKDVMKNVFFDSDDYYVEADKGYFAYVKVTYKGCLLGCKEE